MKEQSSSEFIKYLLVITIGAIVSYSFYMLFNYHEARIVELESQVSGLQQELINKK